MNNIDQNVPLIENYLDYREFLTDYYQWRKLKGKFSYQVWADELNLSSKGYLRLVISGKRPLREDLVDKLAITLRLKKEQFEYFKNLIKFNQSKDFEMREVYFSKLQQSKKLSRKWVSHTYDYLADEWCPRIHVLLAQEGLEKTTEAFSKNLGLPLKKVEAIFERLESLGYAQCHDEIWVAKDVISSVPDQVNDLAVQSFHKKSLEKAVKSITDDPETRHYNATYFVIPSSKLEDIRDDINEFSRKLLKKYGNLELSTIDKNQLYQINVNAIPMSDQLIHSPVKDECARVSDGDSEEKGMVL